jgi:hypothetical protein
MASIGYRDTDVITQAVGATAVVENRFVKVGAAAGLVIPATAQTDAIIGTSRVGGATGQEQSRHVHCRGIGSHRGRRPDHGHHRRQGGYECVRTSRSSVGRVWRYDSR